MPMYMEFKKIAPISLLCATFIVGCSFQKNPNKGDNKEVVKVGMTKHELEDEIVKMDSTSFPDRLAYAIKSKDKALALKIIEQQPTEKINEYGSSGATAIEVAVKAGEDDLTMQLLRKGASPYLPRRGTAYSPFEYLQVQANQNRDVLDMIEISDRKFFESGRASFYGGMDGLLEFIVKTRFPFLKKLRDGSRLIDELFISGESFLPMPSRPICYGIGLDVIVGFIEKTEGPISGISDFQYAKLGVTSFTQSFYERGLKGADKFSSEQRLELLSDVARFYSISSLIGNFKDLSANDLPQKDLEDVVLLNVKTMGKKQLQTELLKDDVVSFLSKYPEVYRIAYNKADMDNFERDQKERQKAEAAKGDVTNVGLPGGKEVPKGSIDADVDKLMQAIIDFDGNFKSCE